MQLLKLVELTLILSSVLCSKGGLWTIKVNKKFETTIGSNITIPCTFTHPSGHKVKEIFWKTDGKENECSRNDVNKQAFVFHPNISCVLPKYINKVILVGNKTSGNCSLSILNIQESLNIFMRLFTDQDKYSFKEDSVFINVNGSGIEPKVLEQESSTYTISTLQTTTLIHSTPSFLTSSIYLVVCVPAAALLIFVAIGTIAFIKHKRSRKVTRQESGYYINFSRATSDPPKREATCKKLDMEPPEEKAIDEPIYINVQAPTNQMSQSPKNTDSVYANMDYST